MTPQFLKNRNLKSIISSTGMVMAIILVLGGLALSIFNTSTEVKAQITNLPNKTAQTAQNPAGTQRGGIQQFNILGIDCLFEGAPKASGGQCGPNDRTLVGSITDFLLALAYPVAILVMMWGGYQYFLGGIDGKSNGITAVRSAIIGLVFVIFSQLIVTAIRGGNIGGDQVDPLLNADGTFNVEGVLALANVVRQILVALAGGVAILVIMWGGYKYFFSSLDWEKEGGAKSIRNGVVGLVIVFIGNTLFDAAANISRNVSSGSAEGSLTALVQTVATPLLQDFTTALFALASVVAVVVISWGGYKYYFAGVDAIKEDGLKSIRYGVVGLVAIFVASFIVNTLRQVLPVLDPNATEARLNIQVAPIANFFTTFVSGLIIPSATALTVFFLVWAGYNWITSNGDQKKVEMAQKGVRNAIIGLIVLLLAATMVQLATLILTNLSLGGQGG